MKKSDIAILRARYIEIKECNRTASIKMWNEIRGSTAGYTIDNIVLSEENDIQDRRIWTIIFSNNKLSRFSEIKLKNTLMSGICQTVYPIHTKIKLVSLNSATTSIRKGLDIRFHTGEERMGIITGYTIDGITCVIEYIHQRMSAKQLYRERMYLTNITCIPFEFNFEPLNFNREKLVEYCRPTKEKEIDPEVWIDNLFNEVTRLGFVEDVDIDNKSIIITLKPFVMHACNHTNSAGENINVGLQMPRMDIVFLFENKRYEVRNQNNIHPHVSGSNNICMGSYETAIRNNWFDIQTCVIHIYELLTTWNPGSPYFKPLSNYDSYKSNYKYSWSNLPKKYTQDVIPGVRVNDILVDSEEFRTDHKRKLSFDNSRLR